MTTHVYAVWSPCSSEMIRGIEVDTTVPARIETNIPSSSPERDSSTWRCDITSGEPSLERVVDMQILRNNWLTVINHISDR